MEETKQEEIEQEVINEAPEAESNPTPEALLDEYRVLKVKSLRKCLDKDLQEIKELAKVLDTQEIYNAHHYITNAVMWLGMELKRMNEPNPYPNSYKPENSKIDATADGLKM